MLKLRMSFQIWPFPVLDGGGHGVVSSMRYRTLSFPAWIQAHLGRGG